MTDKSIIETFNEIAEECAGYYPKLKNYSVNLDLSMKGRSLGRCIYKRFEGKFIIKLNKYYAKKNPDNLIDTCYHEIAHAIDFIYNCKMSHD